MREAPSVGQYIKQYDKQSGKHCGNKYVATTINNLAQVPHEHILTKAYEGTRKKNNHKFRHIAVNTSSYRQSCIFPQNCRSMELAIIR